MMRRPMTSADSRPDDPAAVTKSTGLPRAPFPPCPGADGPAVEAKRRRAEEIARAEAARAPAGGRRRDRRAGVDSHASPPVGDPRGSPEDLEPLSPEETRKMLHELRVHQIQLELQNEDLRRAQEELDATRARYFDLYDLAPVGYCTISEQGLILETNLTAAALLGATRGALVKQPFSRFIFGKDMDIYYLHRKQLFESNTESRQGSAAAVALACPDSGAPEGISGELQACELRMVKKDGTVFWVHLEATVAESAVVASFVERCDEVPGGVDLPGSRVCRVVLSDITRRKLTEQALHHQQEFARTLLENMDAGVVACDAEGKLNVFNRMARAWHGVDATEISQEDWAARSDLFMEDGRSPMTSEAVPLSRAYRGEVLREAGMVIRVQGQPPRQVISNCAPLYDAQGQLLGAVAVMRDITEQRRVNEALRRTAEELSQSNDEVRQFAYIVSHDLRGPLCNVGGFVSELRRSLVDLSQIVQPAIDQIGETERAGAERIFGRDVPEALGFIDASVIRMDRLVNSLLRLSQVGRHEQNWERLALGPLVSGLLESVRTQIEACGVTVTVHPLPEVMADRTSVELILSNILGNAVLYLDPTRPGRIEIDGTLNAAELFMKISDNGRGIAEEHREEVFAPFRRAGAPDVPGEGMGLAYVQALLRRQGGRIWFDSKPGVGTTFSFVLPVASP
jgi:PAS domain S-box-containing protein